MLSRRKPLYKYFIFWTIICCVSAAPSFWITYREGFNLYAMLLGILIFIVIYSMLNASIFYERLMERFSSLRKALALAFWLRIIISATPIVAVIPLFKKIWLVPFYFDMFPGLAALKVTAWLKWLFDLKSHHYNDQAFLPTLVTTLIDGALMSAVILAMALLIWMTLAAHHRLREKKG